MVCTLINPRNDVIKCSKLKWNHEPLGEWFHCQVLANKSTYHGKKEVNLLNVKLCG